MTTETGRRAEMERRLRAYAVAAGVSAIGLGAAPAHADVIYTNLDPDQDVLGGVLGVDIDQDGMDDFVFEHRFTNAMTGAADLRIFPVDRGAYPNAGPLSYFPVNNAVYADGSYTCRAMIKGGGQSLLRGRFYRRPPGNYSNPLDYWEMTSRFVSQNGQTYFSDFGGFLSRNGAQALTRSLAIRFTKLDTGTQHFGWIRVRVDPAELRCTVLDFAYEGAPSTLIEINVAPTAANLSVRTDQGVPVSGTLPGTDADAAEAPADTVEFKVGAGNGLMEAANGTVSLTDATAGRFTYTPAAGFSGTDTFEFRLDSASEQGNLFSSPVRTVTVTVAPASTAGPPAASGPTTVPGVRGRRGVDGGCAAVPAGAAGAAGADVADVADVAAVAPLGLLALGLLGLRAWRRARAAAKGPA